MSRSGYADDCDGAELWLYRANVDRALAGKRGQRFLRNLIAALDAMPVPVLIAWEMRDEHGAHCALAAVGAARGTPVDDVDPKDHAAIGKLLGIAACLAAEVEFVNDEAVLHSETPAQRWKRMRAWAERHLRAEAAS